MTAEPTAWIKATASNGGSNCVQMRRNGASIEVRDSKNPDGPSLSLTPSEIQAWLEGARQREFEGLL